MKIIKLISENYNTYVDFRTGGREAHLFRISAIAAFSIAISIFFSGKGAAFPIMATVITILTGFAFAAIFSSHVIAESGLPAAKNESDRYELKRLAQLLINFRMRSNYFIYFSIINASLLVFGSLELSVPDAVVSLIVGGFQSIQDATQLDFLSIFRNTIAIGSILFFSLLFFLFFECLYTFYRLAETIIAIVDLRRDYIKASR